MKSELTKRMTIEENYHRDREKLKQLSDEIAQLKAVNSSYLTLQDEHHMLQDKYKESELALEELGTQLSMSKLQVSDLMEEQHIAKRTSDGQWAKDKEAKTCRACDVDFTVTRRRHHCRNCGEIFCNLCSDNKMPLPSAAKPVRVCDECNVKLLEKQTVVTS
uniref:RUN and FYVE domain-containing protein 2 n=1 Tax=Cacopsylla melanoneura TaxID=428564 RepID=A0A8D9ADY1_9HEMI